MLLAGTSFSVFSVMRKIPSPTEEYWYRDLKKKTSSSSSGSSNNSSNNNNNNNDDDENNSCYNYCIDEIPYLFVSFWALSHR
jgi:hypothetical protein